MEAKNLYARQINLTKKRIGTGGLRWLLLVGMIWLSVTVQAQTAITYTMSCTSGTLAPTTACSNWTTFRASLAGYVFSSFTVSGSLNPVGLTCSDPTTTNLVAAGLVSGTVSTAFGGHTYNVGGVSPGGGGPNCGVGTPNIEFDADGPGGLGACNATGYSIRPNMGVAGWWGGIGSNCAGATQTMTLTFNVQPVYFVNGTQNGSGVYEVADTVCQNSGAQSINSKLTVSDSTGLSETWILSAIPAHGTVLGLPVSGVASGSNVSPTGVTYTPAPGFSGVDSFKVQVSNGSQTAVANITVTVNPSPTVSGGSNVSICIPASATLTGSGATTYAWAPAGSLTASTGTIVSATPSVTTTYTVTGTTGSCSNSATVTVSVNPTSAGTISGSAAMCTGQATTFSSTIAGGVWSSTNTSVATINGTTGVANGVSTGTSTIDYTVTNSCGTFVASYPVTVNIAPPGISVTPTYVSLCPTGPAILMSASADTVYGSVTATNSSTTFVLPQNAADSSFINVSGVPAGSVITGITVALNINAKSTAQQRDGFFNLRAPNGNILNIDNGKGGSVSGIGYSNITISSAGTLALPSTTLFPGISYIASLVSGSPTSGSYTTPAYRSNVTAWSGLYSAPNGQWTLITDNSFNGTEDTLISWSITVNYAFVPTVTWSSATGLFTNSGATTAYTTGASTSSVYALPVASTSYTAMASIGACSASQVIPARVNSTLYVPVINGPSVVCPGATITLSDSATGGSWVSNTPGIATIGLNGTVTGVTAGTVVMTYNYTQGSCATQFATKSITVNPLPAVAAIGGSANICLSSVPTTTLTDATTGGTSSWISGNIGVATVGTSSGVVTGVSAGTAVITYSYNNGVCTNNLTTTNVTVATTPTSLSVTPLVASICPTGPAVMMQVSGGTVPATVASNSGTIAFSIPYSVAGTAGVTTPLTVSGIPAGATVTGIAVNFNATESFDGDLELNLMAPNSQVINLLSTGTANSGQNYVNTTISSAGVTPIPNLGPGFPWTGVWAADASMSPTVGSGTNPPTTSTWTPLLSANPNGTWTLVGRTNFSGNTATLTSWAITVSYTYQSPVTWLPVTGLFTNSAGTTAYTTGTQTSTVYALPATTTNYTATATNGACANNVGGAVTAKVSSPLYVPVPQGPATVCANGSITLTDSTTGGVWSSGNTAVATVNPATGVVSGVGTTGGTANIIYTLTSGICSGTGLKAITVNALPATAAISGPGTVCSGSTITLTDATSGGTWSSASTSVATIGTSGIVTPVSVGSTVITYANFNGICTNYITTTVNSLNTPASSAITPNTVTTCASGPAALLSSSGGAVAASATFSNTTPQSFGPSLTATSPVTVSGIPVGATITGIAVNVNATQFSGGWDSDDLLNLQSPNTNILNLVDAKGGSSSTQGFVNTTISSAGTTAIPATGAPYTGTYAGDTLLGVGLPSSNVTSWSSLYTTAGSVNGTWNLIGNYLYTAGSTTINNWSLTIYYTVPPTFTWASATGLFTNSGATASYTGSAATSVYAQPASSTTYTLTASNGACTSTATAAVSVNPSPVITVSPSSAVCAGSSATLTAVGGISYTWSPSAGLSAAAGPSVTATPLATTTYTVTGANSFGCTSTATVTVTVNPLPAGIDGNTQVSTTITTQLSDVTPSGTWTSSVPAIATVNSATGLVAGVTPGNTVITYTLPTSCSVNTTVNVNSASVGMNFNGATSYIQLGNILSGGQSYTKEAWINVVSTVSNTNIVSSPDAPFYIQSGHLQAANNYLSSATYVVDPGTFPTGQWVYVAVTYDQPSSTMKLYRNGILVASNTTSATYATGSLQLGAYSGAYLNNETMDEVRIWNVARTQLQIQTTMNCDIPQNPNLISYYRFDEGTAGGNNTNKAYVLDYSGNGNCGTLNGFALTGPGSNFVTGAVGDCSPISITVPAASNTGSATVCVGQTTTLSNSVALGSWTSGNPAVATVISSTGVVTGVTGGTANITYTLNCGIAVTQVTVNTLPSPITGNNAVCEGGGSTALSDATTPGTWTSSNGNATIGSTSGTVTGVTAGNATITYTIPNGCYVTSGLTINPLPVITGSPNAVICYGQSSTLTAGGGTMYSWAPSAGLSATTSSSVVATPTATTTYTVTGTNGVTLTYNQAFTGGVIPSTQCTAWTTYRASLVNTLSYSGFTIKGSNNTTGFTCTDPAVATAIANALRTGTATSLTSDGHTWYVGTGCGGGCGGSGGGTAVELAVDQGTCACGTVAAVRPGINNPNWGGISGLTCGGASQTLEVDFFAAGCTNTATITVSVNPLPVITTNVGSGTAICNGSSATITASGASTYTWSPATGLDVTTGSLVNANPTSNQSYLITGTDGNGCVNTATVAVTVNPLPVAISGSLNFCLGSTVILSETTPGGTWSSSNTAVATVDVSGNVSGVTTGVDTIIYTLPTSCSTWVSGTVNPLSDVTVTPLTGQTVCNGASTTPVAFSGTVAGTVFNWSNSLPSIGTSGTGTGDTLYSFTAVNTTYLSDTGYFIVTPVNNGCPGTTANFYIAVNPTPDVYASNPPQTLCNGTMTAPISFAGDVAGTIFTWTNTNSSIGIGASGTGNIASFAGIDTSSQILTSTITVNTSAAGCTGTSNSFTITIDPTPLLSGSLTSAICDSALFNYIPSTLTLDSTFTWTRAAVTGISEPASSGVNNTNEYLNNTTTAPIGVTYEYVTQANGCTDTQNVVVTVNPKPHLTTTHTPAAVCDSTLFHYIPASTIGGVVYTWSRATVTGISNVSAHGNDSVNEYLVNTTPNPVVVPYVDTLSVFGCQYTEIVTATVNPKPLLNTPVTLPQVCDSTTITYVPGSATTGTTFTWSRAAIAGNPAASGVDTIHENLVNTGTASVIVTYVDTLKANGCRNTENVSIRVMPTPILSSSLTPAGICDSTIFNYTPASATAGTGFTWVRPFVVGIFEPGNTGAGNPNEELINTTNDNLNVTYIYTLNDSGCTHVQDVVVAVHPTPVLSSPLSSVVCSGSPYLYGPASYTAGTGFSWKRGLITGITPATDSGSGLSISETLVNGTNAPIVTGYQIKLTANGCSHLENITVTVDPSPAAASITTFAAGPVCTGTMFQNFGTSGLAAPGDSYTWTANNAQIYAQGSGHQYILVNFTKPGAASVVLATNINAYGCRNYDIKNYNVSGSIAQTPSVIYFNGQFVCQQDNLVSYQWGYDDAITLDSTLIPGENNPNYFNNGPDLTYKYYWVATTDSGGCSQKTYYNVPSGITNITAPVAADIKLYPNPATEELNVVFNDAITGKLNAEVISILGQKMMGTEVNDHKALLNVASLPAGTYMVVCYSNGIKLAALRFVKN